MFLRGKGKEDRVAFRKVYIPKDATLDPRSGEHGEVYLSEGALRDGRRFFGALGFRGTAGNPTFNYSFLTPEAREKEVADFFAGIERVKSHKATKAAEKRAFRHTLKVGDILHASWGYNMTHADFYEVVALHGVHDVSIRPIGAIHVKETSYLAGIVKPNPGDFTGEPTRHRVTTGNSVKVRDWGVWARPTTKDSEHRYNHCD